jgi:hypothetical protein
VDNLRTCQWLKLRYNSIIGKNTEKKPNRKVKMNENTKKENEGRIIRKRQNLNPKQKYLDKR